MSVDVIVSALAAGAAAGGRQTASAAIADAYQALKALLSRRLRVAEDPARLPDVLNPEDSDPQLWRSRLEADLTATGADTDPDVLAAAHRLLEVSVAKYQIDASQAKGVQIGDHNRQENTFN
jgi:hypothetical protein